MQPEDLVNRALDAVGAEEQVIGDLQSGTKAARVALRHYVPCLEQLLRGAYWNFARKQAPMTLLGAACGYVGAAQQGQVGTQVIPPWTYEYAWPEDCIAARFVPWNNTNPQGAGIPGNNNVPDVPPTGAGSAYQSPPMLMPARMLVASDTAYPLAIPADAPPSQWWNSRSAAPDMRKVILTDVPCAELVYTVFTPYPSLWDPLFQEAFCALLGTWLALPLNPDKKEGRALRAEQIAIAKAALSTARVRDGDEGWPSVQHIPDWIRARSAGAGYGGWGGPAMGSGAGGAGVLGYGWGAVTFGDGSAY